MLNPQQNTRSIYKGEPHQWLTDPGIADRAAAQVLYTLVLSSTAFQPIRELWTSCYKHYTGQVLNLKTTRGSQVPTGQPAEIVDTFLAEYIVKLFRNRPLCGVLPRGPEDIDGARALERLLQYNFDHMHAIKVWYEIIKSMLMYGSGIGKVRYVEKIAMLPGIPGIEGLPKNMGLEKKIAYRGPWIDPLFLFDYYPDPRSSDVDDDYPQSTISYNSWDHFERNAKLGIYDSAAIAKIQEFKELPENVIAAVGNRDYQSEQRAQLGFVQDTRLDPDGILTIEWEGLFRPTLDSWPEPSIITVANGVAVRAEPTPFVSRENGLIVAKMDWIPGQLYGCGLIQKNMPQIHAANIMLNMALTHAADTVRGLRAVKPDALYFPQELDSPPGGNLLVKKRYALGDVVQDLRRVGGRSDIMNLLGYAMERVRAVSAARDIKAGLSPKGDQTATESSLLFQQIAQRFQLPLMMFEETGIIRAARKMHYLNRQFLDPEFLVRVLDKDATHFPLVSSVDLAIDPDFVCMASQRESNSEMVVAQLNQAIRNLIPLVQSDMKYLDLINVFLLRIFEEQRFPNIGQIKAIMAAPVMQMPEPGMGGGGQGGAGQPAPGRRDNRQANPKSLATLINSAGGRLSNIQR